MSNILPGMSLSQTIIVRQKDSAKNYGSGLLAVYSTPAMIALMEKISMELVQPLLKDGFGTVGTSVNIKHIKATPVGGKVKCTCILEEVIENRLIFRVKAWDEKGKIGEGTHERFIIDELRFLNKVKNQG
jgi:predicted thioesterase